MQKINNINKNNTNIIEISNGYVVYNYKQPNAFIGLKNFNFNFQKHKIYCIIGKSGSGKSTLINLFNGLNRLNYGDIKLENINLNSARNLNNVFLNLFKYKDTNIINEIINNKKQSINYEKSYYLTKVAKDANEDDVKNMLLNINNNFQANYYKLNFLWQKKLNINNKTNQYYLIEVLNENNLSHLNVTKNFNDLMLENHQTIKEQNIKRTKKIKQYKQLRKEIGLVSQFPEFQLFKYTVIDDVSFGLRTLGYKKKDAYELAKKELLKLGIKETHFNNSPFALSGGQKRRVAIAGILAINGNTLIFDEPTAGLDPVGEREMINIILNQKKEHKNIFVVTHSMDQVLEIADEILVIHEGKLIANGSSYQIFNNDEILKNTNIEKPYVIKIINELIKKNKKYIELNKYEPKTIEQLSEVLIKLNKDKI